LVEKFSSSWDIGFNSMLRILVLFYFIIFFTHCPITNKLYLKANRVTGIEAKLILQNRLSSFFIKDITDSNASSLAGDYLIPTLAGINDSGVYSRRDVESCATKIFLIGLTIDEPNITANRKKKATEQQLGSDPNSRFAPPLLCQLQNIDAIIDLK
jgi:small lipoprotein (TIGR04452 family)